MDAVVVLSVELSAVLSAVLPEDLRFIVGRSGSSDGVLPLADPESAVVLPAVLPDDAVVLSPEPLLSDLRFIVGRSGSSAGVLPLPAPEFAVVVPDDEVVLAAVPVPASPESESLPARRFIVGRSGSLVEALVVPDPLLPLVVLLWSVPADEVVSPAVFVVSFGRLPSFTELVRTGRVFDGFSAVTLFGAATGFTLPYPNQPSSQAISPAAFSACRCRANARSSSPLSIPAFCSAYTLPLSSANGTGRAT